MVVLNEDTQNPLNQYMLSIVLGIGPISIYQLALAFEAETFRRERCCSHPAQVVMDNNNPVHWPIAFQIASYLLYMYYWRQCRFCVEELSIYMDCDKPRQSLLIFGRFLHFAARTLMKTRISFLDRYRW